MIWTSRKDLGGEEGSRSGPDEPPPKQHQQAQNDLEQADGTLSARTEKEALPQGRPSRTELPRVEAWEERDPWTTRQAEGLLESQPSFVLAIETACGVDACCAVLVGLPPRVHLEGWRLRETRGMGGWLSVGVLVEGLKIFFSLSEA